MKTISKADLVDLVAEQTNQTKAATKATIDTTLDIIINQVALKNTKVQLTGFGTFERRTRQARDGVKPGTSERIRIPEKVYPAFKPSKTFKDEADNAPF